jgi:TPR repeat protein
MCNMRRWLALGLMTLTLGARADFNEGVFAYANGDYEKALQTFLPMAQASNDPLAQYWLGMMHLRGQGVSQDDTEAAKFFTDSAKQGLPNAQMRLAELYTEGRGVAQDYQAAYAWYAVADRIGHKKAAAALATVGEKLTSAELASAQRLAEQFIKDYSKPPAAGETATPAGAPAGEEPANAMP